MRRIGEPGHQPDKIHGDGDQDVLELGLGKALIARLPEAEHVCPLSQSAFDAGSQGIPCFEVGCLLPLTSRQQGLVFRAGAEGELAAAAGRAGALDTL